MPANACAIDSHPDGSRLIATRPLPRMMSCARLPRLMQTSIVGGVSVTEQTALAVMPQRPRAPSVVMTFTPAGRRDIASRKFWRTSSRWVG